MALANSINTPNPVGQSGSQIYSASATGNDTYVITLSPVPPAYVNGMTINFKVDVANTGAATLNVNGLGAIAITKAHDQALTTGEIEANQIVTVVYNSTGPKFQMQSQSANGSNNLTGTANQVDVTAAGAPQTASLSSTMVAPGTLGITTITANRAVTTDASKVLVASATTDTELGYVSGVTSAIQTQLNAKISQSGAQIYGADSVGTDSYAITLSPAPAGYVTGMVVNFKAGTSNTGGATLNVNGLGALAILKLHDQALITGDIESGQIVTVVYDGTQFQMQSQIAQTPAAGTVTSVSGTANQIDVATGTTTPVLTLSSTLVAPGTVTLNADPVSSLQAATKQYVDAVAALGLEFKASVVCATTTALTVTYANGAAGVGATLTNAGAQAAFATDGITPAAGSRVLVKNQASTLQNGIYTLTTAGTGATNWVLTRAVDFDTPAEIQPGSFVAIDTGTTLAVTSFLQTATVTTVGTDPITFSQFTYGTTFPAINVTGNINNTALTASTALVTDGSKNVASSATTSTELGYVSGVTSALQTQINAKVSQSGAQIFGADSVGTDAYAITLSPAPGSYTTGMTVNFSAGTANTGGATLNVNALGAKTILKQHDQALATGDIEAGQIVTVVYDGTNFQMQSQSAAGVPTSGVVIGAQILTGSGTYTPTSGTTSIWVRGVGGGAGGANGGGGTALGGGGGGAGAYGESWISSVAASYAYACGAGGAAGPNNGAASTFGTAGATLNLGGGNAGGSPTGTGPVSGGAGGTFTTGTFGYNGAGGGYGGNVGSGGGGHGGSSPLGGGAPGAGAANGSNGTGYGAGGAGGSGVGATGGAGTNGCFIVFEYK